MLTFGLICYFCPGSLKINILTAQYQQIFNEQALPVVSVLCFSSAIVVVVVVVVVVVDVFVVSSSR